MRGNASVRGAGLVDRAPTSRTRCSSCAMYV